MPQLAPLRPKSMPMRRPRRRRAQALLSSGSQFFVPVTVVEELEWVRRLRHAAGRNRGHVRGHARGREADRRPRRRGQPGPRRYRQGLDFSDALHLAQSGLCTGLATFDTRFTRTARRLGLEPAVSPRG